MHKIRQQCQRVVDHADFVSVDCSAIVRLAGAYQHFPIEHWVNHSPLDISQLTVDERIAFILLFNSLSFSYWGTPKWTMEYKGKEEDGAYGLIMCIVRGLDEGLPLLDPKYWASFTEEQMQQFLRGNVEIPLFNERLRILQELGRGMEQFGYDCSALIAAGEGDMEKLSKVLLDTFPSLRDEAAYKGEQVMFCKRLQMILGDLYQGLTEEECGPLVGAELLTACADYKLPMILRREGVLVYDEELAARIDQQEELKSGSPEEVEIRAATIWAIHLLTQELQKSYPELLEIHVNDYIWTLSQSKKPDDKPYHLTRTIAY